MTNQTQTAVGFWPFDGGVDIEEQIRSMKSIVHGIERSQMPAQIPIRKAQELIKMTVTAALKFITEGNDQADAMYFDTVADNIRHATQEVRRTYDNNIRYLNALIRDAKAQGRTTVDSRQFNNGKLTLTLHSIVGGYEALQYISDVRPWIMKLMPWTVGIFVAIGRAIKVLLDVGDESLNMIGDAAEWMLDILKWGTVAGIAYIAYLTLKPDEARP